MELSDLWVAVISALSALGGAVLGSWTTSRAERKNRESERRRRCIDRIVSHTERLENAYSRYAKTSGSRSAAADLALAIRSHILACNLIDEKELSDQCKNYAHHLKIHYLFFGEPQDPLDSDIEVPTADELVKMLDELSEALRAYESK